MRLCVCVWCCRFQPDKGFSGADQAPVRDGPVQFEKDTEEDPFGLNKFLTEAKKAKRPVEDRCVCVYNNVMRLCVLLYVTGMLGQGELRDQSSKPAKKWFCLSRKMTGHYFCAHALLMYTTH